MSVAIPDDHDNNNSEIILTGNILGKHRRLKLVRNSIPHPISGSKEVAKQNDILTCALFVECVMTYASNDNLTIGQVFEVIENAEGITEWNRTLFLKEFVSWLHRHDYIERKDISELYNLSMTILVRTGRNYLMLDIVRAFITNLRAWEFSS